jgi:hypothetical protein
MPANDYHLVSHWRVPGTTAEVAAILDDAVSLPRWWGAVYREVELLDPGDPSGAGKTFAVRATGFLPYALRLRFRLTEQHGSDGFAVAVDGDLEGSGTWSFVQEGDEVAITFDWRVRAQKPVVRRFSALFKPLFAANHHWTMRKGEESLRIELARRRARTAEERAALPAPPGPFDARPALLLAGGLAASAALAAMFYRRAARQGE